MKKKINYLLNLLQSPFICFEVYVSPHPIFSLEKIHAKNMSLEYTVCF